MSPPSCCSWLSLSELTLFELNWSNRLWCVLLVKNNDENFGFIIKTIIQLSFGRWGTHFQPLSDNSKRSKPLAPTWNNTIMSLLINNTTLFNEIREWIKHVHPILWVPPVKVVWAAAKAAVVMASRGSLLALGLTDVTTIPLGKRILIPTTSCSISSWLLIRHVRSGAPWKREGSVVAHLLPWLRGTVMHGNTRGWGNEERVAQYFDGTCIYGCNLRINWYELRMTRQSTTNLAIHFDDSIDHDRWTMRLHNFWSNFYSPS